MNQYTIINNTTYAIWWKDGGWYSGDLPMGQGRDQESDHVAMLEIYGKVNGKDVFWGRLWVSHYKGRVVINGPWNWIIEY